MQPLPVLARYPFHSDAKKFVESLGLTLPQLIEHPVYGGSVAQAQSRVLDSLRKKISPPPTDEAGMEQTVLAFALARLIANLTGNKSIVTRWSVGEAEAAFELLRGEDEAVVEEVKRDLEFEVKGDSAPLADYLKLSTGLAKYNPRFKLVNRVVEHGQVKLDGRDGLVLLGEAVRLKVAEPVDVKNAPKELKVKAASVRESVIGRPQVAGDASEKDFPPCIQYTLGLLSAGEASHNTMFILGTYLLGRGFEVEQVMEFLRRSPKFDETTTRYQLEFLSGEKGGTKYSCPTCSKIKSYGLCKAECGVRHPLQFKRR